MLRFQKLSFALYLSFLMLHGCGDGEVASNANASSASPSYAPAESPKKIAFYSLPIPPAGFAAAVGMMHAIDIHGTGAQSKVEVDWLQLHAVVDGTDTVILGDGFLTQTPAMNYYGLYLRNPWYGGDRQTDMPFAIQDGQLVVEPSRHPDRVFHWWNT